MAGFDRFKLVVMTPVNILFHQKQTKKRLEMYV